VDDLRPARAGVQGHKPSAETGTRREAEHSSAKSAVGLKREETKRVRRCGEGSRAVETTLEPNPVLARSAGDEAIQLDRHGALRAPRDDKGLENGSSSF